MKKILSALFFLALALPQAASAKVYSTISGYVLEDETGVPIAGLTVRAVKMNSAESYVIRSSTDEKGFYVIRGATEGVYSVSLIGRELVQADYYSDKKTVEVTVTAGKNIVNNNYTVKKAGFVSGRVFKGDGTTPYVGIKVDASAEGGYQFFAITDVNGFYKIGGLPDTENAIVSAFVPGAAVTDAGGIKIVGGDETKNIDIVVKKDSSNLSIKGRVLSESTNQGIENVKVMVLGSKSSGYSIAMAQSDAKGNFEAYGLPSGIYTVKIVQYGYDFFVKEGIEVKDGDPPVEIEIELKPTQR
ncbi:MAG: carboxypeptidase-like regulatory domain-containing protein [Thermodesulfobacteriota bacterium]